jgi:hypothetical protein
MPGFAAETQQHRTDAAVGQHRLAARGLGDDGFGVAMSAGEEGRDAARVIGFLVAAEQERRIAAGARGGGEQAGGSALGVAGAQANRAIVRHPQVQRVGLPCGGRRHRVQVHVEHARGRAAPRDQRDGARTMVDAIHAEARQLRTDVIEDAAGADQPWRVAGVERHQRLEMAEDVIEHVRLLRAC